MMTYGSKYPGMDEIRKVLEEHLPGSVLEGFEYRSETTLVIRPDKIRAVCLFLRDSAEWQFVLLADVAGVDWPKREKRFDVVYNLYSVANNLRLRLKVQVGEGEAVPSVVAVWSTANWLEREVFDMFGVRFLGHPDLRRILMWETYREGFPLRKSFPLRGHFNRAEQTRQALAANPEAHYSLEELSIAAAYEELPADMKERLARGERGEVA